ncbi:MAG: sugar transferase [Bacteroidota bacterium]|nr:sugar transferase [Bacteroidota bacterium]
MYNKIKRIFDIFTAVSVGLLLLPLTIIIVLISAIVYKCKVFFVQERIGYRNQVFMIYKFRTMCDEIDNKGNLLPYIKRVNPYGEFLRKFSFDEIPQLYNILKGDLSLIGPRPLLVAYMGYYTETELLRHSVKPGITGLAQVYGRNSIQWSKRFDYDLYYIENQSFTLDVKIFFKTFIVVLNGQKAHFSKSLIEERMKVLPAS